MNDLRLLTQLAPITWHRVSHTARRMWPLLTEPAERGGAVLLVRSDGRADFTADVQEAAWSLPDIAVEDVPTLSGLWASWPGRRGLVMVSGWEGGGRQRSARHGDLLRLAAVWAPGLQVGLVTRGGQPVEVSEAGRWTWLLGERAAGLAELGVGP